MYGLLLFFTVSLSAGPSYETTHIRTVRPYELECKFKPKKGGMTIFVFSMACGGTFEDPLPRIFIYTSAKKYVK